MKNAIKVLMGLVLALAAVGAKAAGSFEGEVDMKMSHMNAGETSDLKYFIKGHKVRTQMEAKNGYNGSGIFDWKTDQMTLLMDKQKMYMVSQLHPEKFSYGKDHHFKMTKTSRSENILGYNCRQWVYKSDQGNGKVWFTTGIGSWWGAEMVAQSEKIPSEQKALVSMVVSQKLFPMKWEMDEKSGNPKSGMEVVKVEKRSLSPGLFEVPAGYKKFDMGAVMSRGSGGENSSGVDPLSAVKSKLPF